MQNLPKASIEKEIKALERAIRANIKKIVKLEIKLAIIKALE